MRSFRFPAHLLFAALTFLVGSIASAQSTNSSTNLVITLGVNLTTYSQSTNESGTPSVITGKLTTQDVIAAFAAQLGLDTNNLANAKLLLEFQNLGNTNNQVSLSAILRTSSGDTTIDNTNIFIALLNDPSVKTIRKNGAGNEIGAEFGLMNFEVTTTNLVLTTQGKIKINEGPAASGKQIIDSRRFPLTASAPLTGTATIGTNFAVVIGTLTATSPKVELPAP